MTPEETLRWLTGLRNLGSRLGVDRMRLLSARLGNPERAAPCFHVAGTNGKGSVCAMIEAIQRAQGRRTGLYTSPHLVAIGERIQVDRNPLSDAAVVAHAEALRPHYEAIRAEDPEAAPTFFELITAAAFVEFAARRVDVTVLETGLGGRLDATVGDVPPEAEAVIVARAQAVGAPLTFVRDRFPQGLPEVSLPGEHQRRNAGAALLACELATRLPIDDTKARAALLTVEWAGRWQSHRLADGRRLIVDGSHNEEGARVVEPLLASLASPTIIVGALGSERARPLVEVAARHAATLVLVRPDNERACSVEELAALVPAGFRGELRRASVAELFPSPATCVAPGDTIVVLGSLYLVGEVLARLRGQGLPDAWQDRLPPVR